MFTAKDARIATQMQDKKPTFDRWMAATIARPTVSSRGSGYPAQWSADGIIALEITRRLGAIGLDLRVAANIAEKATKRNDLLRFFAGWLVAIDLETLEFKGLAKMVDDMDEWRTGRSTVLILDMDEIERTVAKRLGMELREFMEVK